MKGETAALEWTLKYAADDPRVQAACAEMAKVIRSVFEDAKIKAVVHAQGLPPHALQKALREHDYDFAYTSEADLDDPVRLALFFDASDGDAKLQQLLRTTLQYRQFTTLQENMQTVHVHLYETMPLIPLWQLDLHVLAHPSLRVPPLDARSVFARIAEWKL